MQTLAIKVWRDYSAESIGIKMASEEKHVNTKYFSITKNDCPVIQLMLMLQKRGQMRSLAQGDLIMMNSKVF